MKSESLSTKVSYRRIELSIATILFLVYTVFKLLEKEIFGWPSPGLFDRYHISYNYFRNDLVPSLIQALTYYLSFVILSASIKLKLKDKSTLWRSIALIVLVYVLLSIITGTVNTYRHAYIFGLFSSSTAAVNSIFNAAFLGTAFILPIFIFYHLVSRNFPGIFHSAKGYHLAQLLRSIVISVIVWLAVFFVLLSSLPYTMVAVTWLIAVPYCLVIYYLNVYWLLPLYTQTNNKAVYLLRMLPTGVLLCIIAVLLYTAGIGYRAYSTSMTALLSFVFLQIISVAMAWFGFRSLSKNTRITSLTTALGQSVADLDFLRSQINPHFLFNVLNTIYGTAMQENAERTGEAVLKLGELMRFMLHENMQERILLQREIEYIRNYISLQELRTSASAAITINTDIDDYQGGIQIAPMLLIPFIENAFKHGISMQQSSYIKTSLRVQNHVLHYDVHNSINRAQNQGLETTRHGVGLDNVKQRLKLIYPQKHELVIRETASDFFIHLTINL